MGDDKTVNRAWDYILRIGMPLLVLGLSASLGLLLSVDRRVVAIESSRFTSAEGQRLAEEMHAQTTTILVELRGIQASMPTEIPPKWFVDRVDMLEKRVLKLEEK